MRDALHERFVGNERPLQFRLITLKRRRLMAFHFARAWGKWLPWTVRPVSVAQRCRSVFYSRNPGPLLVSPSATLYNSPPAGY